MASCPSASRGGGLQQNLAPSAPSWSRSSAVRNRYCGQVSPKILKPAVLSFPDLFHGLLGRHVDDQYRHVDQFGKFYRPMCRLAFADAGMGDGMIFGRRIALVEKPLRQPLDHLVIFRVNHDEGIVGTRDRQHVQHLPGAIVKSW